MSYELYLNDENGTCQVDSHQEGGTYCVGTKLTDPQTGEVISVKPGTQDANLNITYNYCNLFPFRKLHGTCAGDMIPWLEHIIEIYGTERHEDYWKSTKGNVGYCLSIILSWCKEHPKATISIF